MGKRLIPALVVTLAVALTSASGAGATTTSVVMSGLDNPRGLAFGPEGALYVAEAGRGGSGPCIFLHGAPQCYGPTGAVSRLWRGEQERVATGLPSYGSAASTTGPHDISFLGRGGAYVTIGIDRKSTRLNSSHQIISYAVFCLKKKKKKTKKKYTETN